MTDIFELLNFGKKKDNIECSLDLLKDKVSGFMAIIPKLSKFAGETFIVKIPASYAESKNEKHLNLLAQELALLKQLGIDIVVTHGDDIDVDSWLSNAELSFNGNENVKDSSGNISSDNKANIVEMILKNYVGGKITAAINAHGGNAISMSGKDANLINGNIVQRVQSNKELQMQQIVRCGFYGQPNKMNTTLFDEIRETHLIPVISPICKNNDGGGTCIACGKEFASFMAKKLCTSKLVIFNDHGGLFDRDDNLITAIGAQNLLNTIDNVREDCTDLAKICANAACNNVSSVHVVRTLSNFSLLIELFSKQGIGTVVYEAS